ncbi:MAG: hypothetical protein MUF41_04810 [Sphingopyxis sp.]|nr:hypothetical protein [Sphingopyxis sp.]
MISTPALPTASLQSDHAASMQPRGITGGALVVGIFAALALHQILLWRFIGLAGPWAMVVGAVAVAALSLPLFRACAAMPIVPWRRIALVFLFALALYLLGGEGRYAYANIDWQVRDAVLRDMALHPWPFAYIPPGGDEPNVLRAPIGMFLLPALAYKLWGPVAADHALLLQNATLLTALLSAGSLLFDTARARITALVVVALFSGQDAIGQLLVTREWVSHLESWIPWLQFSSHITQAFWVPQHAFAGWLAALLFLLWRRDLVRIDAMLMLLPLTALWSPLALLGALPFVAWAALVELRRGGIGWRTIALPSAVTLLALPGLLYLAAGGDGVGARVQASSFEFWALFMLFELGIWVIPLMLWAAPSRYGRAPLRIAALFLLAVPFVQIGWSIDFMMRASIPGLAILAVLAAEALTNQSRRWVKIMLATILVTGSVTGMNEVIRAVSHPASPRGQCSFFGAWDANFGHYPKGSYLAPMSKMSGAIRPERPAIIQVRDPASCWAKHWHRPTGM